MNYLGAFLIGGVLCLITQILSDITKRKIVTILTFAFCLGIILSACGVISKLSEFGCSGVFVMLYGGGDAAYQGMDALLKGDAVPIVRYILLIVYCAVIGVCAAFIAHKLSRKKTNKETETGTD